MKAAGRARVKLLKSHDIYFIITLTFHVFYCSNEYSIKLNGKEFLINHNTLSCSRSSKIREGAVYSGYQLDNNQCHCRGLQSTSTLVRRLRRHHWRGWHERRWGTHHHHFWRHTHHFWGRRHPHHHLGRIHFRRIHLGLVFLLLSAELKQPNSNTSEMEPGQDF